MNKIDLLKARREEILQAGSEIRKQIQKLTDEESFVEFDSYSFSKNDFYDGVGGEGVITGSATINDNAVYVIAQNKNVLSGGITDANCKKINNRSTCTECLLLTLNNLLTVCISNSA